MARSSGLDAILHRPPPSAWQRFRHAPILFLAQLLYHWRPIRAPEADPCPVTVVCLSDTHNHQPAVPPGDILIHAGDLTQAGTLAELQEQLRWLRSLPHRHKIVVAGNHDLLLDARQDGKGGQTPAQRAQLDWGGPITYLDNGHDVIYVGSQGRTLRVYGSPSTPEHGNWAFQYPRHVVDVWKRVRDNTDILVTHGPPRAHLDGSTKIGCTRLLKALRRVRPRLHVFGHAHDGYGVEHASFFPSSDFQLYFEDIIIRGGGFMDLLRLFNLFLRRLFAPVERGDCTLVNCAITGGVRDELRREPIVVVI